MLGTWLGEMVSNVLGTGPREDAASGMSDLAQAVPWGRDEAELVTELQAGSETAFDWLVTYYHAGVYNLVYGILADASDASDVTQEVFLKAFRGIRGFRGGSSLKTWLYRISVRQALNERRWWWRHHRQQVSIDSDEEGEKPALQLKDAEATPFEEFATHETQATVRQALAQLPGVFRSAVILRDMEGLSYEEVAEVLEVSVGTVKSRIVRGRRILREILDPILHAPRAEFMAKAPEWTGDATLGRHDNIDHLAVAHTASITNRAGVSGPERSNGGGR